MSMDYIRKTYGVPAKRGARIEFTDTRGRIHEGRIVGSRGMYLRADMPTIRGGIVTLHPTSDVRYLPNASLDRPAASAGTVGGVVGLLPVGLIPIPPMILQEANRRAMENGDLTFGHGCALGLALCATWGLCAVAIWIKRAIVRRFHKANPTGQSRPESKGQDLANQ